MSDPSIDPRERLRAVFAGRFPPGTRVRHKGGGEYEILAVAEETDPITGAAGGYERRDLVIYRDLRHPDRPAWARPLDVFLTPGRFEVIK